MLQKFSQYTVCDLPNLPRESSCSKAIDSLFNATIEIYLLTAVIILQSLLSGATSLPSGWGKYSSIKKNLSVVLLYFFNLQRRG